MLFIGLIRDPFITVQISEGHLLSPSCTRDIVNIYILNYVTLSQGFTQGLFVFLVVKWFILQLFIDCSVLQIGIK